MRLQNRTNPNSTEKTLESLKNDVTYFQSRGQVIIHGDFNARTNTDPDYVDNTEDEELFGLNLDSQQLDTIPKYRNSKDKSSTCQREKKTTRHL